MKILYIWDADYPWDVRVEKICKTLHTHGFEMHLACRNLRALPPEEVLDTIHLHRLTPYPNSRLNRALSFPLFFNPLWITHLHRIVSHHHITLLIVRDLPLSITASLIAKWHKIPVIFDMAEDYPAMNRDIWRVRKFKGCNLLLRNPYLTSLVERYALKHVDQVWVVVEESKKRLVANGVAPTHITIVSNTPEITHADQHQGGTKFDNFTFVYTGGIQLGRGIQTVIRALPLIAQKIPHCTFLIIGDGYGKPALMKLAQDLKVDRYLHWMEFVEHRRLYELIARCHVGIIPHFATDHTNTTIPNKIFDYMSMSLPVLSSTIQPIQRILAEEKCGLVFKDRDSNDLADKLYELYTNETYQAMGEHGRRAVLRKYNWNEDTKRLLTSLINLLPEKIHENGMSQFTYRRIKGDDLTFYHTLRNEYNLVKETIPKGKLYLKYFLVKGLRPFSQIYKSIYDILIFEDVQGTRIGFLHLSNLHLLRMCGSYKSDKKKYLELYSLHPEFRGKRFASALMRAVQDKLYADVRIFGVISSKNTKALINAEKTGRKTYATVYKYKGSLKDLNLYSSRASHYENIVMKEYLSGKDEHTLYELYNKNTPLLIAQIEAVAPEDFAVSFADRYISFIHRRLNKIIEKIFIIYYNRIKMLALSIKIMQNAHYAEIKVVGDLPNYRAGGYILAETLRKTYQAERLDNIYVYVLDYQHSILNSIKALNFTLDDEFCLVCNYEKFITMSR